MAVVGIVGSSTERRLLEFLQRLGKMVAGGRGGGGWWWVVIYEDGMPNLGGRLMSILMRAGILVGGVIVVAVGIVSFSKEQCLSLIEVEFWRVGYGLVGRDIFDFGGGFVVVVVEEVNDLEL